MKQPIGHRIKWMLILVVFVALGVFASTAAMAMIVELCIEPSGRGSVLPWPSAFRMAFTASAILWAWVIVKNR